MERGELVMDVDKNVENLIKQEIDKLKRINVEMMQQTQQEINRNNLHIYALEQLLEGR